MTFKPNTICGFFRYGTQVVGGNKDLSHVEKAWYCAKEGKRRTLGAALLNADGATCVSRAIHSRLFLTNCPSRSADALDEACLAVFGANTQRMDFPAAMARICCFSCSVAAPRSNPIGPPRSKGLR